MCKLYFDMAEIYWPNLIMNMREFILKEDLKSENCVWIA